MKKIPARRRRAGLLVEQSGLHLFRPGGILDAAIRLLELASTVEDRPSGRTDDFDLKLSYYIKLAIEIRNRDLYTR
ncbi:MAG: hypothetical protein OXH06_05590 [Gemmatimonadetes bacterium]|nr:hypothetical protein [Gemmatimonadota bacterium]